MSDKQTLYRKNPDDKTLWLDNSGTIGEFVFTFDKVIFFNLFQDFPDRLSPKEYVTFCMENLYWKNYFLDRCLDYESKHEKEIDKVLATFDEA